MEVAPLERAPQSPPQAKKPDPLRQVAIEFEAVFISEMLKHSGVNKSSETMGGGFGEEAFASMLNDAYAKALADTGGFGLADKIYDAMRSRSRSQNQE